MRQLLQRLDDGKTIFMEVPTPRPSGRQILVATEATVISAGTERMLVGFGRASWLEKARQQPDKVKQVVEKARTDGLSETLDSVRAKLSAPIPLGYCHAGVVVDVGKAETGFRPGDRVVTNGPHAEQVAVPCTLAAQVPDGVPFDMAAFTPVAAIALQGIRLVHPVLGEAVVVMGLGLVGLLAVQLLIANGCKVIGIDPDEDRRDLAAQFGAITIASNSSDVAGHVRSLTNGVGADAVLLTLSAQSNEPIRQAADMTRVKGRLVLVGVTGLDLRRDDFYKKELTFSVSCSYGPGRYDEAYEVRGVDYPLPHVRWTARRNFEAVLQMMSAGRLDPTPLVTHRFPFDRAIDAYSVIVGNEPSIGVVLEYQTTGSVADIQPIVRRPRSGRPGTGACSVGVIGAGNFANRTLLPILREQGVLLRCIASSGGTNAAVVGEKFDFERVTSSVTDLLDDEKINTVFILTRHDTHAALVECALKSGKHVFVEKPLALTRDDLLRVENAAVESNRIMMVGFNRRFAPLAVRLRNLLKDRAAPVSIVITVNAGAIPGDHWTQNPLIGGGRIVGEACHFIDLARSLVEAPIADIHVTAARNREGKCIDDVAHISLRFVDGSTTVVHYLSSGSRSFPKERIECFVDGQIVVVDNWRRLRRFPRERWLTMKRKMDKGHHAELSAFLERIRSGGDPPIPLTELIEVSGWSITAAEKARGEPGARPETD